METRKKLDKQSSHPILEDLKQGGVRFRRLFSKDEWHELNPFKTLAPLKKQSLFLRFKETFWLFSGKKGNEEEPAKNGLFDYIYSIPIAPDFCQL